MSYAEQEAEGPRLISEIKGLRSENTRLQERVRELERVEAKRDKAIDRYQAAHIELVQKIGGLNSEKAALESLVVQKDEALGKIVKDSVCGRKVKVDAECPEYCAGRRDPGDVYWCDYCIATKALSLTPSSLQQKAQAVQDVVEAAKEFIESIGTEHHSAVDDAIVRLRADLTRLAELEKTK